MCFVIIPHCTQTHSLLHSFRLADTECLQYSLENFVRYTKLGVGTAVNIAATQTIFACIYLVKHNFTVRSLAVLAVS